MVAFVKLLATAQRLILANGRSVTFIRHDETLSDAAKPWLGPADARTTPSVTSVQSAVFVEPRDAERLGFSSQQSDLVMRSDKIMILAAGTVDLTQFQEVLDGTTYWKITDVETLQPGSLTVLSFVGVKR